MNSKLSNAPGKEKKESSNKDTKGALATIMDVKHCKGFQSSTTRTKVWSNKNVLLCE